MIDSCATCALVRARDAGSAEPWDEILRTSDWDVAHAYDTSLPGWLVVVSRRHVETIGQLPDTAASSLGPLLRNLSAALEQVVCCAKTYVLQFAEAPGHQHVHFHVVPRMADMPEANRGANVFKYLGVSVDGRVSAERMNDIARDLRRVLAG